MKSELLKGKRVFLDTTEFVAASCNVSAPALVEFRKFCERGQLTLLTTEITRLEIKNAVKWEANKAQQAVNCIPISVHLVAEASEAAALRTLKQKLGTNMLSDSLSTGVDEFFSNCRAVNLPVPAVGLTNVLKCYFE